MDTDANLLKIVEFNRLTRGPQNVGQLALFVVVGQILCPKITNGLIMVVDDANTKIPLVPHPPEWNESFASYEFTVVFTLFVGKVYKLKVICSGDEVHLVSNELVWDLTK